MIDKTVARTSAGLPAAIGRYRILDRLGKGAMGVVYRARDDQLAREVALKVMMTDVEHEPETRTRFFREAQITSKLLHRNIVTVLDMGEQAGRLFIVMELLKGETLTEFLKKPEPPTLEQKVDLMIQACNGFAVAHAQGVVHRDIKPGNLFVVNDGGLKILDFGVARLASSTMTASGLIIGTPDFMSPEQARAKGVDDRSDVFSAAAVFYLMVTGRNPFEAPNLPAVLQKVVREDPLPIREHEAPQVLARIISKGLSKEPNDRYQRFADFGSDLIRFKQQFDGETRQLAIAARGRFDEIQRAAEDIREMRAALSMPAATEIEEQDARLREQCPFFVAGATASLTAAPSRRHRVMTMLADFQAALAPLTSEVERLRAGLADVERAEGLLGTREAHAAIACFDRAGQTLQGSSRRVSEGLGRAQALHAEMQAIEQRVEGLFGEARAAQGRASWATVVERVTDILTLQPQQSEAMALLDRARSALAAETEKRRRQVQQLLGRAESAIKRGQLDEAEVLLRDARAVGTDTEAVAQVEARLGVARTAAAARVERGVRISEELMAVRAVFDAGDRDGAITRLGAFARENPDAGIETELGRFRSEAERVASAQARRAAADAHLQQAEAHWTADEAAAALRSADMALAVEPALEGASRIQKLARAKLRERAEAAAKSSEAARHVAKGAECLAAGRFDKAAREAQAALALEPGRADASGILAESRRLASEAEAARRERAEVRDRERKLAETLHSVRRLIRAGDFERAVWSAENALLVEPDHQEAQRLLAQAKEALAARRLSKVSTDDTVRFSADGEPTEDPDSTVVTPAASSFIKRLMEDVGDRMKRWGRRLRSSRSGS